MKELKKRRFTLVDDEEAGRYHLIGDYHSQYLTTTAATTASMSPMCAACHVMITFSALRTHVAPQHPPPYGGERWTCGICTLENAANNDYCECCEAMRPVDIPPQPAEAEASPLKVHAQSSLASIVAAASQGIAATRSMYM